MTSSSAEITTIRQKNFEDEVKKIPPGASHYVITYDMISYWSYRDWFRGVESGTQYKCWHYWNGASWQPEECRAIRKSLDELKNEDIFKELPITDSERESMALLERIRAEDRARIAALQAA